MIYNEVGTGAILISGDFSINLLIDLGTSGGVTVSSVTPVGKIKATDVHQSGAGLALNGSNVLKDIEEIHETSKPNKKKLLNSTPIQGTRKQVYFFPQDQGWCDPKEKCDKAVLATITQKRMAGYLPPK